MEADRRALSASLAAIRFRRAAQDPVAPRLRRALGRRCAMALDELCNAAGLDEAAVRQGLRDLMASGDVERLRPLGWAGEDLDYFRLSRQQDPASSWRFHEAGKTYRAA